MSPTFHLNFVEMQTFCQILMKAQNIIKSTKILREIVQVTGCFCVMEFFLTVSELTPMSMVTVHFVHTSSSIHYTWATKLVYLEAYVCAWTPRTTQKILLLTNSP